MKVPKTIFFIILRDEIIKKNIIHASVVEYFLYADITIYLDCMPAVTNY